MNCDHELRESCDHCNKRADYHLCQEHMNRFVLGEISARDALGHVVELGQEVFDLPTHNRLKEIMYEILAYSGMALARMASEPEHYGEKKNAVIHDAGNSPN